MMNLRSKSDSISEDFMSINIPVTVIEYEKYALSVYQFWKINAGEIDTSKSNFFRLYAFDNINASQFSPHLLILLPLIQSTFNSIH